MSQPGAALQYKITYALSVSKKLKWWDRDRIGKPIGMIRKMVLLLSAKKRLEILYLKTPLGEDRVLQGDD